MRYRKRVTIQDIADELKISRGTVDRVLNNRGGVNSETRQRVLQKAKELGYKPNRVAQALVRRKPLRLGVMCPSEPGYFWDEVIKGIMDAGKEMEHFGVQIDFRSTGARDAAGEAFLAEKLLADGAQGLAIAPANSLHLQQVLAEGINKGIPVVLLNNDIPDLNRLCFIGQNSFQAGKVAGNLLGLLMAGQGTAVIVTGFKEILSHRQRVEGIQQVLRERYPDIHIAAVIENFDDGQKAYRVMSDLLAERNDIRGVVVTNVCVGGIGSAVLDHGLSSQIRIVGFDLASDTEKLMREGVVDATICQNPYQQGYEALNILARNLLFGEKPSSPTRYIKLEVIVRELLEDKTAVS